MRHHQPLLKQNSSGQMGCRLDGVHTVGNDVGEDQTVVHDSHLARAGFPCQDLDSLQVPYTSA
jgi:hypothetical protein